MKSSANTIQSLPWYRYGIVWLVVILPLIAVAASITTLYIAHQNAPVMSITSDE